MWPDRVSSPGPLALESDAEPTLKMEFTMFSKVYF